jgi:hypothetical protein
MPTIEELFIPHSARSSGFSDHEPGKVTFVTNGFRHNGVVGFVKPKPVDRVFRFTGIVLSAFVEATVQAPPFIGRGNGGSGLIVLEPRKAMSLDDLGFVAAYINEALRWRFSWYRQASVDRIKRLEILDPKKGRIHFDVRELMPELTTSTKSQWKAKFAPVLLDSIYKLIAGDYHAAANLPSGDIPLISCGDVDNGIVRFVDVPPQHVYEHRLTIAFNGATLATKYHPYKFATKDDVALCEPRTPLRLSTEVFIQLMMNRERWRYSYYRKCYMEKLKRFHVPLPVKHGMVDEDVISSILETNPYWQFVGTRLAKATIN